MTGDIVVERAGSGDDELAEALSRLLPQLSNNCPQPTVEWIATMLACTTVHLLVARAGGRSGPIAGVVCLTLVPQPSGIRARLEDLVVDEQSRGRGVAVALVRECVARARAAGARDIDLTSNPVRTRAIAIYEAVGFARRGTNAYRLSFMDGH